jgi:hypothetical protein
MRRLVHLLAAVVAFSGCGGFNPVGMERQRIAGAYSVAPQAAWSRQKENNIDYWTIDGPTLDLLQFTSAVKDGAALYQIEGRQEMPRYRRPMSENEVMEFVVDSLAALGAQKIEPSGLRPAAFGPWPGFRFDLSYQTADGLDMLGSVLGTVKDGDLYLIIYTGAAQHYYPKHKPSVEAVISSIQA